jgi:drug/metabolite transporter (DMT)-like permease
VTAVGLACLSALLFGAMVVGLRIAMQRRPGIEMATVATVVVALLVALVCAAVESPVRGVHARAAWPFILAGLLSPGGAQILVTRAIRDVGASRTSVVLGMAPLVSVTIALIFLGEPVSAPLLIGAVLIVAGGVELARERDRPAHLLSIGLLFALAGTILFAIRDNVLRWLAEDSSVPPAVAAAAALLGGSALITAAMGPRLRGAHLRDALPYVPVGIFFGLSYVSLFEAFYRGRVSVVAPLVATESLWSVLLAAILLRHTELIGRRLVLGAVLVVAGGALIGVFR